MTLGDGQPLHGWELMRPGRVRDLKSADILVAANHLRQTDVNIKL